MPDPNRKLPLRETGAIVDAARGNYRHYTAEIDGKSTIFHYDTELSRDPRLLPSDPDRKGAPESYHQTDCAVYVSDSAKHIVVAFEGTDVRKMQDLMTCLRLWLGVKDEQFREADRVVALARKKYPGYTIEAVGHSLGASQAAYVAGRHGIPATAWNSPGVPKRFLGRDEMAVSAEKTINIQVDGDPVSGACAAPLGRTINIYLPPRPAENIVQRVARFFAAGPSKEFPGQKDAWDVWARKHNFIALTLLGQATAFRERHTSSRVTAYIEEIESAGFTLDQAAAHLKTDQSVRFDGRRNGADQAERNRNKAIYNELAAGGPPRPTVKSLWPWTRDRVIKPVAEVARGGLRLSPSVLAPELRPA